MNKLKLIDLFAGAGGLSLGFEKTGKFEIKLAVEINKHMRETYQANHKDVILETDIRTLDYDLINEKYGDIDVVIGGPPCQGFSNANRQKNSLICGNNQLVKEYVKAIEKLRPKAFVMENVKNIISDKHKFFYTDYDKLYLKDLNIKIYQSKILIGNNNSITKDIALRINYNIKNNMKFFSLKKYKLCDNAFSKLNIILKKIDKHSFKSLNDKHKKSIKTLINDWNSLHGELWNEEYKCAWNNLNALIVKENFNHNFHSNLKLIVDTQNIIRKLVEIEYNNAVLRDIMPENDAIIITVDTYNVFEFIKEKLKNLDYTIDYEILNAVNFGVPQSRERLILIGVRNDIIGSKTLKIPKFLEPYNDPDNYVTIQQAISDLEVHNPFTELTDEPFSHSYDKISKQNDFINFVHNENGQIFNHVTTDSRKTALKRFEQLKPGQNFHDLDESLKSTYTDPARTQNTIYKRLEYDKPSSTVCNVRKSMWIHPTKDRAVSIREAARLQSFPDNFVFKGTKDAQYQQIGNAVPPLLGKAVAEMVLKYINSK